MVCQYCGKSFIGNANNKFCSKECKSKYLRENKKEYLHICIVCGKKFNDKKATSKYCSNKCKNEWTKNNPRHTLICQYCGKEFKSNNLKQEYCSDKCAHLGARKEQTYKCKNCGKEFIPKRTSNVTFCSRECAFEYKSNHTGRYCKVCGKELKAGQKIYCSEECKTKDRTSICEYCGKEFISEHGKKYCSIQCQYEAHKKKQIEKHKIIRRENFVSVKRICRNCGKEFKTEFGKGKYAQVFCSDKCKKQYYHTKKHIKRRLLLYSSSAFDKDISLRKLYKRDKGICAICGGKVDYKDYYINEDGYVICGNNYPSIDHIIPLSKGGTHTWDNVQLAHMICNSIKCDSLPIKNDNWEYMGDENSMPNSPETGERSLA